jgi:DNA helicase-2/ATP-dependent DNA helicase PcrA
VTRAEQVLRISWADNRTFGTRTVARDPSPYLEHVEQACAALHEGEVPADWRAFFADRRAETDRIAAGKVPGKVSGRGTVRRTGRVGGALADLSEPQRELFDALKQWRAGVARASSVPAYVVFHDTALEAIAHDQPRTPAALLSVAGVGPVKVNRYGDGILAVVADHVDTD